MISPERFFCPVGWPATIPVKRQSDARRRRLAFDDFPPKAPHPTSFGIYGALNMIDATH